MNDLYYSLKVAGLERQLPLLPIGDDLMIGAFVIFGDTELTVASATALNKLIPAHDVMITGEMARQAGEMRYILARKSPKLYMKNVFTAKVHSITTGHEQQLCLDGKDAEYIRGKRVVIVDDVISTGESLRAMEALVDQAGGTIAGRMAILAEGDAIEREDLIYLEKLPLFKADGTPIE